MELRGRRFSPLRWLICYFVRGHLYRPHDLYTDCCMDCGAKRDNLMWKGRK